MVREGFTRLTESESLDFVKSILASGRQLEISNPFTGDGWPLLSNACWVGHMETAQYLITAGADPNEAIPCFDCASKAGCKTHTHFQRYTSGPLYAAAHYGDLEMVEFLVGSAGANVKMENSYGHLHIAAARGHLDVLRYLLDAGADKDSLNYKGTTALAAAARQGCLEAVLLLLAAGANPSRSDSTNDDLNGTPPLATTAFYSHTDSIPIMAALLSAGADVHQVSADGSNALHLGSMMGFLANVRFLIGKGARVDVQDAHGHTALTLAAMGGHVAVVKLLVEAGFGLEMANSRGATPVRLATESGHSECVRWLIEAGADPQVKVEGWSLLLTAANAGHLEVRATF